MIPLSLEMGSLNPPYTPLSKAKILMLMGPIRKPSYCLVGTTYNKESS